MNMVKVSETCYMAGVSDYRACYRASMARSIRAWRQGVRQARSDDERRFYRAMLHGVVELCKDLGYWPRRYWLPQWMFAKVERGK